MSELAAQTTLTPSGLTRSVDRLQEQGLVVRRVCPEDRRGAFAVLTPAGRELMDRAIPDHLAHIDELLSNSSRPRRKSPGPAPPQAPRPPLRPRLRVGTDPRGRRLVPGAELDVLARPGGGLGLVLSGLVDRRANRRVSGATGRRPGPGCRRGCLPATQPASPHRRIDPQPAGEGGGPAGARGPRLAGRRSPDHRLQGGADAGGIAHHPAARWSAENSRPRPTRVCTRSAPDRLPRIDAQGRWSPRPRRPPRCRAA